MAVKDRPSWPGEAGDFALAGDPDALPLADVVERRPVLRLPPAGAPAEAVAAERLVVSRRKMAAALGPALAGDADLLRHAADRVAARLPGAVLSRGAAGWPFDDIPPRAPLLLPLPLGRPPVPAPRRGLIGVLPLAAAAGGRPLAERRAELAALGWRLGIDGLDAAALRFVPLAAVAALADLLLLRWSPALARGGDALRGADPQSLVLTGCGGADAVRWGRAAGLSLFSGSGAEAALRAGASTP